jgi:hypothetical protein
VRAGALNIGNTLTPVSAGAFIGYHAGGEAHLLAGKKR